MRLIKLDAIDSTNDFLKALATSQNLENFTVVTAEAQNKGRGQMGAKWETESGKNLIVSILIKDTLSDISEIYNLNVAITVAIVDALREIPNLLIKWPNDIMSASKKIGGILIENIIRNDASILSIVGIGINVNQSNFENLPKASSLSVVTGFSYDRDELRNKILAKIQLKIELLKSNHHELRQTYTDLLFKKDVPMPFENSNGEKFMGIIQGIDSAGKLLVRLADDTVQAFDIKQIQMLY